MLRLSASGWVGSREKEKKVEVNGGAGEMVIRPRFRQGGLRGLG